MDARPPQSSDGPDPERAPGAAPSGPS
ncbi:MAG: hypothetical protein JWR20_1505, partial [Marmoricola sp.]|nr:hypothetical protein [Marmoricola sp.]